MQRSVFPIQNSNEYLLAKIGFDTAENEPRKICPIEPRFLSVAQMLLTSGEAGGMRQNQNSKLRHRDVSLGRDAGRGPRGDERRRGQDEQLRPHEEKYERSEHR